MKKRKRRKAKGIVINQSTLIRFLVVLLIILVGLVIVYIFVYEPKVTEDGLDGGLGTLKWDFGPDDVVIDVLDYVIVRSTNLTINVNLNWSSGNFTIGSILMDFEGVPNYCNYTQINNLVFGINQTYPIIYGDKIGVGLFCNEIDFSNVTGVSAYAEVDIPLTQESLIPNINFYTDDSRNNLLHLGDYFSSLVEINYSVVESPENGNISVVVDNDTKNISISVLDGTWFGVQRFNLTATSEDGEILNTSTNGDDMSFSITIINGIREVPNEEPEFDLDDCEVFSWVENTNKTIDMDYCWDDADGDSLTYEYGDLHDYEENISVTRLSGNRLKFAPDRNFNGSTYLRFYANDSKVRVSQKVDIRVLGAFINTSDDSGDNDVGANDGILEIKSSNPSSSRISFSISENKNFVISAENYENIEWYVDGKLKREGRLSYRFEETTPGEYSVQVKIINGTDVESRTWEVTIDEEPVIRGTVSDIDVGQVVFYLIISVLVIIILLVIWLFIVEKNKKNKKVDLGFGVSVVPNPRGGNSSSNQFNIPKE